MGSDGAPSQPTDAPTQSTGAPTQSTGAPSQPTSEEPSYTTGSSGYDEPESSTPSAVEEPASTPQAESGVDSAETPPSTDKAASSAAVGAAAPVTLSESSQRGGASPTRPSGAAPLADPGDQASSGSYALPLLAMIVLGLILGFACVRLWRRHQRRQLEALWRQQDATWEAALRRVGPVGDSSDGRLPVAH